MIKSSHRAVIVSKRSPTQLGSIVSKVGNVTVLAFLILMHQADLVAVIIELAILADVVVGVDHDAAESDTLLLMGLDLARLLEVFLQPDDHSLAKLTLEYRCPSCLLAIA